MTFAKLTLVIFWFLAVFISGAAVIGGALQQTESSPGSPFSFINAVSVFLFSSLQLVLLITAFHGKEY